ncbi:MAG: HD domain-containing protein [Planctomycetota bacterium]|nr:HD domain-containing protein [Planctomycetota bacterium]
MNCHEIVSQIFALFHARGHQQYGEDVTETQHALQCATFARNNGESPAIVAACLLHDYGHLVHDLGENIADQGVDAHHETLGANRLRKLFKPEVVEPVRLHVAAKRYLCWKEPGYYNGLSDASQRSLLLQGGPMTDNEGHTFESHPFYKSAVTLRKYDDMGKVTDMKTLDFEDFRNDLEPFVLIQNEIHEPK